jgi:hypothetical protein
LEHTQGFFSGQRDFDRHIRGCILTSDWSERCRVAVFCGRGDVEFARFMAVQRTCAVREFRHAWHGFRLERYPDDYTPFCAFGISEDELDFDAHNQIVITTARMPLWPATLGFAALPALSLIRAPLRRARRRRRGLCVTCAYDLTGNTSGTCPECGAGL